MSDLQKIIALPYVTGFNLVYSTGGLGYRAIVDGKQCRDAGRHGETCDRFLARTLARLVGDHTTAIEITVTDVVKDLDPDLN